MAQCMAQVMLAAMPSSISPQLPGCIANGGGLSWPNARDVSARPAICRGVGHGGITVIGAGREGGGLRAWAVGTMESSCRTARATPRASQVAFTDRSVLRALRVATQLGSRSCIRKAIGMCRMHCVCTVHCRLSSLETRNLPTSTHHEASPFTRPVRVWRTPNDRGWVHGKATTQAMRHTLTCSATLRGMGNECACEVRFIL